LALEQILDSANVVSDLKKVSGSYKAMGDILKKIDDQKKLLALTTLGLNEKEQKNILTKAGLTKAQATELLATKASTIAKVQNAGATNILSASMTRLKAVMVAHPLLMTATVLTAIVGALIMFDRKHNQVIQASIDKSKELVNSYKELQDDIKANGDSISEFASDYVELSKGVDSLGNSISLTEGEFKKYHEITNKIAELFPSMVQGYDSQGNAIIKYKGDVEALNNALEEQRKVANQEMINNGANIFEGVRNEASKFQEDIKLVQKALEFLNGETAFKFNDVAEEFGIHFANNLKKKFEGIGLDNFGTIGSFDFNNLDLSERLKLQEAISSLMREENSLLEQQEHTHNRINSVIQAYLSNNSTYAGLNDELKNAVSVLASSLNPSDFDYDDRAMQDFIRESILTPIHENKNNVQEAISDLLTFDSSTVKAGDYKGIIDSLVATISEITELSPEDVRIKFGVAFEYDSIESALTELRGVLSKGVYAKLRDLSPEDIKIAYTLDLNGKTSFEDIQKSIKEVKDKAFIEITVKGISEILTDIKAVSNDLSILNNIWKDIADGGSFDFSSLIDDKFIDKFGILGEAYDNFVQAVSDSPKDIKACQKAFDDLSHAYIMQSGILEGVTEATKLQVITALEQQGVTNATILVEEQLARQLDRSEEGIKKYALAKATANGTTISTTADIQQLAFLVDGLGGASAALIAYAQLKENLSKNQAMLDANISENHNNAAAFGISKAEEKMESARQAALASIQNALGGSTKATFSGGSGSDSSSSGGGGSSSNSGLKKVIDGIKSASQEIDKEIALIKEKLSLAELAGDTSKIDKYNDKLNQLYKLKPDVIKSANEELTLLRNIYKSKEDIATIDEALHSNEISYYSAKKEAIESDIALIDLRRNAELKGIEGTIEYTEFMMKQIPNATKAMLDQSDDLVSLYEMKLKNRQSTLAEYLTVDDIELNADLVAEMRKEVAKAENEYYQIRLENMDLAFEVDTAVFKETETLKKQIGNALKVAVENQDFDLQIKLNTQISELNLEEVRGIDVLISKYEEQRKTQKVGDDEYRKSTNQINELLEKRAGIIDNQISTYKELAKVRAEYDTYGEKGQKDWEKTQNSKIKALRDEISALNEANNERDRQAEIEKRILEIQELELKLQNLKDEKNIKVLKKDDNGDWDWSYIADYKAIQETENSLADKRLELQQEYDNQAREDQISVLEDKIKLLEQEMEDKEELYNRIYESQVDHHRKILNETIDSYKKLDNETRSGLDSVTRTVDTKLNSMYNSYDDGLSRILDNVRNKMQQIRSELDSLAETQSLVSGFSSSTTTFSLPSLSGVTGYSSGGLNTTTGLHLLHGTSSAPERVLSAEQTRSFEKGIAIMPEFINNVQKMQDIMSISRDEGSSISYQIGNINLPNVKNGNQFMEEFQVAMSELNMDAKLKKAK